MKTFTKAQKNKWLKIAKKHQEADRFIQGNWLLDENVGKMHKGCFFGCMMQTDENVLQEASRQMRLPLWYIKICEIIFEKLPAKESFLFPVQFVEATPTCTDISLFMNDFLHGLMVDNKAGVLQFTKKGSKQYDAINKVAKALKSGDKAELRAASDAAGAASAYAAAYAAYAADDAGAAAAYAGAAADAAYAAYAAADSADAAADDAYAYAAYDDTGKEKYFMKVRYMFIRKISSYQAK